MSYQWLGAAFELKTRYQVPDLYEKYPHLSKVAPYTDSLYAFIEVEASGNLRIQGKSSTWVGPSPQEMGYDIKGLGGYDLSPNISNRTLTF